MQSLKKIHAWAQMQDPLLWSHVHFRASIPVFRDVIRVYI